MSMRFKTHLSGRHQNPTVDDIVEDNIMLWDGLVFWRRIALFAIGIAAVSCIAHILRILG